MTQSYIRPEPINGKRNREEDLATSIPPQIQYVMIPPQLPDPGSPQAPLLDVTDPQEFVRLFEGMCRRRRITDERDLCDNFPDYCPRLTRDWLETLRAWEEGDWQSLKKKFCWRFACLEFGDRQIGRQAMMLLSETTNKNTEDHDEVCRFIAEFGALSEGLLALKWTTENERCEVFLEGLPTVVVESLLETEEIKFMANSASVYSIHSAAPKGVSREMTLAWLSQSALNRVDFYIHP
ncbi:hypothetical protein N7456_008044 [Penicillium angulare]|uniref:Uncharacterized protein n=1 Tax=Penicillium angulare TaxID=116970 RepID=A0A9W9FBS2_9EURO|nr:hypothetical protein N7456_008044 [Penicillium angulare]